jgi:chromosome segregation ATPase
VKSSKVENLKFELEESEETRKVLESALAETKKQLEDSKADVSSKNTVIENLQVLINRLKVTSIN